MATADIIPKVYFTSNEVAQQTDNHPSAVLRWIQRGTRVKSGNRLRLQAVRTPGGWRIKPEWLETFLETLAADRQQNDDVDESGSEPESHQRLSTRRKQELAQVDVILAREGF